MIENNFVNTSIHKAKTALSSLIEKLKLAPNKKFVFLLVGRTGVGTSTVNSLMGEKIAQVGDYAATTMGVEAYDRKINDVNFAVVGLIAWLWD